MSHDKASVASRTLRFFHTTGWPIAKCFQRIAPGSRFYAIRDVPAPEEPPPMKAKGEAKGDLFMVFDVEAIGLHGEGFAVAWVVVDRAGRERSHALLCCAPEMAAGGHEGRRWVAEHVPAMVATHSSPQQVRAAFWVEWRHWAAQGAQLVADCCWPVEARFLAACVDDDASRAWEGPYPLHDLASVQLAQGLDPLRQRERLANELPAHHPLHDARQTARLLLAALHDAAGCGLSA